MTWVDGGLSVKGTAEIRHLETERGASTLEIALAIGDTTHPLPVRRYAALDLHGDKTMVGFEVVLDRELLARCTSDPAHFDVQMRSGRRLRQGVLGGQGPGSPGWPLGAGIDETNWIQPGPGKGDASQFRRLTDPCRLTAVERTPEALVSAWALGVRRAVVVHHPAGARAARKRFRWRSTVATSSPRLPMHDLLAQSNPDDPFGQRTTRVLPASRSGGPAAGGAVDGR